MKTITQAINEAQLDNVWVVANISKDGKEIEIRGVSGQQEGAEEIKADIEELESNKDLNVQVIKAQFYKTANDYIKLQY